MKTNPIECSLKGGQYRRNRGVNISGIYKQPPLTKFEEEYFLYLEKNCECEVLREVNPYVKRIEGSDNGWYLVQLRDLKCSAFDNRDSLEIVAQNINKALRDKVLDSKYKYKFDEITVGFECESGKDQVRATSFTFPYYPIE